MTAVCRLVLLAGVLLLPGCVREHIQSVVHPVGPQAAEIAWLWWFMFIVLTVVFVIVLLLFWIAIVRRPAAAASPPALGNRFIVISGIVLPSILLVTLLIFSANSSVVLRRPAEGISVRVQGHLWWWEVYYPEHDIHTANEIHIPVGRPVLLELTSADVIHSFWVPNLSGKIDMVPGQKNPFWIQADKPGVYRGQCAEYCGLQHALMAFVVVALAPEEFEEWLADKQKTPAEPATAELQRGREIYIAASCDNCHAIRGISEARVGPDLTHIGSRLSLGAGILRNNRGNLAGWIANPQPLKPGNRMPPSYLRSDELMALVTYLESLK